MHLLTTPLTKLNYPKCKYMNWLLGDKIRRMGGETFLLQVCRIKKLYIFKFQNVYVSIASFHLTPQIPGEIANISRIESSHSWKQSARTYLTSRIKHSTTAVLCYSGFFHEQRLAKPATNVRHLLLIILHKSIECYHPSILWVQRRFI